MNPLDHTAQPGDFVHENMPAAEKETYQQLKLAANNPHRIANRLQELDEFWDAERVWTVQLSVLAIAGYVLGFRVNKKWLALSIATTGLIAIQTIQGQTPAISLLRNFGLRSRRNIIQEQTGLKMLRGDFGQKYQDGDQVWKVVKEM